MRHAIDKNRTHMPRVTALILATVVAVAACSAPETEAISRPKADTTTTHVQSAPTTAEIATTTTASSYSYACPSPNANWPLSGKDLAYTSNSPEESLIDTETVVSLQPAWTRHDLGGVSTTPLVVDGVVYYGDWHGNVHASDSCTGDVIWTSDVGERPVAVSLAYEAGIIVASDVEGDVHALRAADGETVWVSRLEDDSGTSGFGAPTIIDGIVIAGVARAANHVGWRGSIVAYDLTDGSELWRLYTDNDDPSEGRGVAVWSSAAIDVDRGLGFIGTGNSNDIRRNGEKVPDSPLSTAVLAFDYKTGEVTWVYRIVEEDAGRDFDIGAPPTMFSIDDRDVVGVGGKSGDFVTLDRDSGEEVWRVTLTNGSRAGGVMKGAAYADGVLFVASNDGFLTDGAMFALDAADGSTLWRTDVGSALIGHTVTTANSVVYAATLGGLVFGFDAESGDIVWEYDLETSAQGGVSIVDGYAFVGFGGGGPPNFLPTSKGGITAFTLPSD